MTPIRFCFGLHLHQPVGNFGYVFEDHVRDVYLPFLDAIQEREFFPVALHISGPLIDWLEANDARYLDRVARLAESGKVELLLAGYYEPILASLPRADRLEQVAWMKDALKRRFGVDARGLWLTERVWEPDLAADLAEAGVDFALVDDRHFLVSGFEREALHGHFVTEHGGSRISLFPIDEKLRYLIPFQSPRDTIAYLSSLRERGESLAVLADDGEKFGGWPGTKEWVFEKGWLREFIDAIEEAAGRGEIALSTFSQALAELPARGLAYLPTASYREMEGWSLPPLAAARLSDIEKRLGQDLMASPEGALVRGAHWKEFQVRYAESNRMHKKMLALSKLCRERGNPQGARRAIGRAQCNDAYWHGVFGGLYLPFLRAAIWRELGAAERELRSGEGLAIDKIDIDYDGSDEIWVHSDSCSIVVAPHRGGAIEELSRFERGINFADALTRRRESYHEEAAMRAAEAAAVPAPALISDEVTSLASDAAPSIHHTEHSLILSHLPPVDLDNRAIFVERVVSASLTREDLESCNYTPLASFSGTRMNTSERLEEDSVVVDMAATDGTLTKSLAAFRDGRLSVTFGWEPGQWPPDSWFISELSFSEKPIVEVSAGGDVWEYEIETVAKSERGLDRTRQGTCCVVRFPIALGKGRIDLG